MGRQNWIRKNNQAFVIFKLSQKYMEKWRKQQLKVQRNKEANRPPKIGLIEPQASLLESHSENGGTPENGLD